MSRRAAYPKKKYNKFAFGMYCEKYNFIYIRNPKVMSTSLSMWILSLDFPQRGYTVGDLYDYKVRQEMNFVDSVIHPAHPFVFTFVRNPFNRLVSGYLNVFVNRFPNMEAALQWGKQGNSNRLKAAERFTAMIQKIRKTEELDDGITFREFVDYVTNDAYIPKGEIEGHWQEQSLKLTTDKIAYDFIGKMGFIDRDMEVLYRILKVSPEDRMAKIYNRSCIKPQSLEGDFSDILSSELSRRRLGQSLTVEHFRQPDLESKVRRKYRSDYELLGC